MNDDHAPVSPGEPPPLIAAKLTLPRDRRDLVSRPRLVDAVERSSAPIVLIDAPLGYGKSLLAQSLCRRRPKAVAWVSLDQADSDPVRLWSYAATAVDGVRQGLGTRALARLRVPASDPAVAIDELVNGMAAFREPLLLVLDDLHTVAAPETLDTIHYASERLPPNARLVVTTRRDPGWPLGQLRARGMLEEVRARDLAFTLAEARELLVERGGVSLETTEVELLVERTEGWPAGLYLALLWLRQLDDPAAGVHAFHADHRHVADYLTTDVLDRLDPERRRFLTHTSVLPRLEAALCDAVLGRTDSAQVLDEVARSNLFLVPLDPSGRWYRYHNLFGELLRLELANANPDAAPELHRRATRWFLGQGLVEQAIDHAFRSGDEVAAAEILSAHHRTLIEVPTSELLYRSIGRLSPPLLLRHPELAAAAALLAGVTSKPAEARRRWLATAVQGLEGRAELASSPVAAMVSLCRGVWMDGDAGAALAHAAEAVRLSTASGGAFTVPANASLAQALFFNARYEEAEVAARMAIDDPNASLRPYGLVGARAWLVLARQALGRAGQGRGAVEAMTAEARALGVDGSWVGGLVALARAGDLAATGGSPAEAERAAVSAAALFEADGDLHYAYALLATARIRCRRGLLERAAADLATADRVLAGFADPGMLTALAADLAAELTAARAAVDRLGVTELPSAAELNVLRLLASDRSLRAIGGDLFISLNTVKSHTRELYRKLGVSSRSEAVTRAHALGLLEHESAG